MAHKRFTKKELIEIHVELHKSLDKLVACWITEGTNHSLLKFSVMELIEWSHQKTINPSCFKDK